MYEAKMQPFLSLRIKQVLENTGQGIPCPALSQSTESLLYKPLLNKYIGHWGPNVTFDSLIKSSNTVNAVQEDVW